MNRGYVTLRYTLWLLFNNISSVCLALAGWQCVRQVLAGWLCVCVVCVRVLLVYFGTIVVLFWLAEKK